MARSETAKSVALDRSRPMLSSEARATDMEALLLRSVLRDDRSVFRRERVSKLAPAKDEPTLLTAETKANDDSDDDSLG